MRKNRLLWIDDNWEPYAEWYYKLKYSGFRIQILDTFSDGMPIPLSSSFDYVLVDWLIIGDSPGDGAIGPIALLDLDEGLAMDIRQGGIRVFIVTNASGSELVKIRDFGTRSGMRVIAKWQVDTAVAFMDLLLADTKNETA